MIDESELGARGKYACGLIPVQESSQLS